jgi:hypothetical protein
VQRRRHARRWLQLRVAGAVVIGAWSVGLMVFSSTLYSRDPLTEDFATYNQAWTLIGQGHLNPFDTVYNNYDFLRSNFELIMWPLALVHVVMAQSVALLWIQDLAVAGSGLVVYLWIVDYLEQRKLAWLPAIGVCMAVVVAWVANPGSYGTLIFDFHMEPISTVFVLLAGRDLWRGRHRRAWIWIGIALMCGTFAAVAVIGLGLSALLAGRASRRTGALAILAAVAWLAVVSIIGADAGSPLSAYSYLAGRTGSTGPLAIVTDMVTHPVRVISTLGDRLHFMYQLIEPVGVIGLASVWGFGVPVVVLVADGLNASPIYLTQAFQNFAVFPFVLLGTVMVLVGLAQRFRLGWIAALVVALAVTAQALTYGATTSPGTVRWALNQIPATAAFQLNRALSLTPAGAEVIATRGVMGRFAGRPSIYIYGPRSSYPVNARLVEFVFDPDRDDQPPPGNAADYAASVNFLRGRLHARQVIDADGITILDWQPPPGVTHVAVFASSTGQ